MSELYRLARDLAECERQIAHCEAGLRSGVEPEIGPFVGLIDNIRERRLIIEAMEETCRN